MCSCGTLAVCRRTRTHSGKRARRLLNKQGGKNCGAPVLRRQGEVEMTHNYPSCHVCDESVTTACSFVKHGRGRSGRRLSLRGLGVNKSGPVLRCDTSRLAGRRRCCFCGNKLHKKIPFRISFFYCSSFWWTPMQKRIRHNKTTSCLSSANFIFGKQAWEFTDVAFKARVQGKLEWLCHDRCLICWAAMFFSNTFEDQTTEFVLRRRCYYGYACGV